MGASASRGTDNQSLIDKLLDSRYSIPPDVERAMRLVDRGDYFEERSSRAYIDLAWRSGHIHLSAPSIYLSVLRHLDLAPGQRFLNVGSGSGYFNTIAGLILGYSGVNHGIELIPENVEFAKKQLHRFLSESDAPLERDFCVPRFIQGNIFHLLCPSEGESTESYNGPSLSDGTQSDSESEGSHEPIRRMERDPDTEQPGNVSADSPVVDGEEESSDHQRSGYCLQVAIEPSPPGDPKDGSGLESRRWPLYDRMYVGAAVRNRTHLKSILRFLKIGGVLIAPVQDELVKITRLSTNRIRRVDLMSVSFAPLIIPQRGAPTLQISPPSIEVPNLLRLCGRVLRSILRKHIELLHNGLPVLGRMHEVDVSDTEAKRIRQQDDTTGESDTILWSDRSSDSQDPGTDSDSTDEQPNGHGSASAQSDGSEIPEDRSSGSAMRGLLRLLLYQSRLLPNGEMPASRDPSIEGDRSADLWMLNLMQGNSSARESGSNNERERVRVQDQVTSPSTSPTATTHEETGLSSNSLQATSSSDSTTTKEPQNGRRKGKRRGLKYQPPSYRYRDEMRRLMSDELNLPDFFIRDALLI